MRFERPVLERTFRSSGWHLIQLKAGGAPSPTLPLKGGRLIPPLPGYSPGTSAPGTHPPAQTACPMALIAAPPSGSEEHITCPRLLVTHSPGPVRTRPMPVTAAPLPGASEQTTCPILFLAQPPRPVTTCPILFTAAPPPGGAQITSPMLFFAHPPAFAEFINNGLAMTSIAQRRIFI